MIVAAIGSDGLRPVVWGFGSTPEMALEDADDQAQIEADDGWDADGSATCEITAEIAARVEAGEVSCEALGIMVTVRDGVIVSAEVRS